MVKKKYNKNTLSQIEQFVSFWPIEEKNVIV